MSTTDPKDLNTHTIDQIMVRYADIIVDCDLKYLNNNFSYYYADTLIGDVGIKAVSPLVYYDVSSAFPTLCEMLFEKSNPDFVSTMKNTTNKKSKLVYISNSLTKMDKSYLKRLTAWAKMVVFAKVFNDNVDVRILEYKKDSLLCKGTPLLIPKDPELAILLGKFNFHSGTNVIEYMRFDKTSVYKDKNGEFEVKGHYKGFPRYLQDQFLTNLDSLAEPVLLEIKQVYSLEFYIYLKETGQDLDYFYKFQNGYASKHHKRLTTMDESSARETLFKVVYPIMYLHSIEMPNQLQPI